MRGIGSYISGYISVYPSQKEDVKDAYPPTSCGISTGNRNHAILGEP